MERVLGAVKPSTNENRLSKTIEGKLDSLLATVAASTAIPEHIPVDTPGHIDLKPDCPSTGKNPDYTESKLKHGTAPNPKLVALVQDYRPKGCPWGEVAKMLNKRGLLSPRGNQWTQSTIITFCQRHKIPGTQPPRCFQQQFVTNF